MKHVAAEVLTGEAPSTAEDGQALNDSEYTLGQIKSSRGGAGVESDEQLQ